MPLLFGCSGGKKYYGLHYTVSTGCPSVLRSDYGTENSILAAVQIALRYNDEDSLASWREEFYIRSFQT